MNNQINLTQIAQKTLNILINDAKTGDESRVTSLWNNILPKFNINIDNGYSINAEYPIKNEYNNEDKADIVVINILKNNKIVFIIECKSKNHDNRIGWDMATTQLSEYLSKLNCNNGIVAVGNKFRFLIKGHDNYIPDINKYNLNNLYILQIDIVFRIHLKMMIYL